jgi:hypothetical protein
MYQALSTLRSAIIGMFSVLRTSRDWFVQSEPNAAAVISTHLRATVIKFCLRVLLPVCGGEKESNSAGADPSALKEAVAGYSESFHHNGVVPKTRPLAEAPVTRSKTGPRPKLAASSELLPIREPCDPR